MLRYVFGPKIDDATGDWRKLHNEELPDVFLIKYYLGDQLKEHEMGRACGTCVGEAHAEFWWGYRRKGIVDSRRHEDNIKMDFKELGWEGVYWILCSVELLGWLMSPEVPACAALYSTCIPVLYSTSVSVLYSTDVSVLYSAVFCIVQYKCACTIQCVYIIQ